jgi:hypothetical protein
MGATLSNKYSTRLSLPPIRDAEGLLLQAILDQRGGIALMCKAFQVEW